MGPMLTYMASCGSTTCDKFDSTTAKWFKIQEVGLDSSTESGWVLADLMNGTPANITLPSNLAPGNYLLRHEIIALHLGNVMGGAEFYPSCSQIIVGGSGTGQPSDDELVSLPGAYSDSDPGIYVPSVSRQSSYIFPKHKYWYSSRPIDFWWHYKLYISRSTYRCIRLRRLYTFLIQTNFL